MTLNLFFDAVMELEAELEQNHDSEILPGVTDYKKVKALAACYELHDFLAERIAAAIDAGELDEYEDLLDGTYPLDAAEEVLGKVAEDVFPENFIPN